MTLGNAEKTEYHILADNNKIVAKFTSCKIQDVWKKYNTRCKQLLLNAEDIHDKTSFGGLSWKGSLKKDGTDTVLRLVKVSKSGYVSTN
jgi:hypothetical protein